MARRERDDRGTSGAYRLWRRRDVHVTLISARLSSSIGRTVRHEHEFDRSVMHLVEDVHDTPWIDRSGEKSVGYGHQVHNHPGLDAADPGVPVAGDAT